MISLRLLLCLYICVSYTNRCESTCCVVGALPTGVSVEADGGVEALAMLEHVEGEGYLHALTLLLQLLQRALQAQPEADLLQRGTARRVAVQLCHLRTVATHNRPVCKP